MLKIITTLTLFLIGLIAQAQVSEKRDISGFSKIDVKNGIEVIYTESSENSLTVVTSTPEMLNQTLTEVKGKTLKISLKSGATGNVKIFVSANNVDSFRAGSKATITLFNVVNATTMKIMLNSEARFNGLTKTTGKTEIYANSGTVYNGRTESTNFKGSFRHARINLSGTTASATITANEKSYCNARNFISGFTRVNALSRSSVVIHAKENLTLNLSDSSVITYYGNPENVNLSEGSIANVKTITTNAVTAK